MMLLELSRNWISYHTDALINSRAMPSWEAADYLTQNLFQDAPNTNLLEAKEPHEEIGQFLQRIYEPIVEAATRQVPTQASVRVQVYTDISLMSETTVLIVAVSDEQEESQLLLMDAIRVWDLVFPNADAFNEWAQTRYQQVRVALPREALAARGTGSVGVPVAPQLQRVNDPGWAVKWLATESDSDAELASPVRL
jgi:hypothetical protein